MEFQSDAYVFIVVETFFASLIITHACVHSFLLVNFLIFVVFPSYISELKYLQRIVKVVINFVVI